MQLLQGMLFCRAARQLHEDRKNYEKSPEMSFWVKHPTRSVPKTFVRCRSVVVSCIPLDEYTVTSLDAPRVSFQGAVSIQTKSAEFPSMWA